MCNSTFESAKLCQMLQLLLRRPVKLALKLLKYLLIFVTSLIVVLGVYTYAFTWNQTRFISNSHFPARVEVDTGFRKDYYSALHGEARDRKASILPGEVGHNGQISSKTYW